MPPRSGKLRLIGGQWGGRVLSFKDAEGLRPSTDRVRETVFNWLQAWMPGAQCLDLFAGSGALGFEAASRGAAKVSMIELNKKVVAQLQANQQLLNANSVQIIQDDALKYLKQTSDQYDVVFIDPPFRQGIVEDVLALLIEQAILKPQARVYLEQELEHDTQLPECWDELKHKTAGQVRYRLLSLSLPNSSTS